MSDSGGFDLDEYLAHMRGIPFEDLDALRRTAPSLELPDLMAKLVRGRRSASG